MTKATDLKTLFRNKREARKEGASSAPSRAKLADQDAKEPSAEKAAPSRAAARKRAKAKSETPKRDDGSPRLPLTHDATSEATPPPDPALAFELDDTPDRTAQGDVKAPPSPEAETEAEPDTKPDVEPRARTEQAPPTGAPKPSPDQQVAHRPGTAVGDPATAMGRPARDVTPQLSRQTHAFLIICAGLVLAFLVWGFIGQLDIVSMAQGEVVPSGQSKVVQHLEGGIVAEIMVREGDVVKTGQPLIVLESTASGADVQELLVRINSLRLDISRLEAEVNQTDTMDVPPQIEKNFPGMVNEARQLFRARRQRIESELAGQREVISQRANEIEETQSRLKNNKERLTLIEEQIGISEQLLAKDLTNRMLHLNLLKEQSNLEGLIAEDTAALNRLKSARREAQIKYNSLVDTATEEARIQLDEKRGQLEEFTSRLTKFEDSVKRSTVRSPVEGIVQTLHVVTQGGVIQPGGDIAEIVPSDETLVVEAKLPASDIGYVKVGQPARIKLASAEGTRFGDIDGEVINVSADAYETKEGVPYYKVRIRTDQDFFAKGAQTYQMVPGVQVLCSIRTGTRSVVEYLLSPFLGSMIGAMQER